MSDKDNFNYKTRVMNNIIIDRYTQGGQHNIILKHKTILYLPPS